MRPSTFAISGLAILSLAAAALLANPGQAREAEQKLADNRALVEKYGLTDLARSFPVDISFSKTVTPTTVLQGQTVAYTLTASNPGPGVVRSVAIQDSFPAGVASAS